MCYLRKGPLLCNSLQIFSYTMACYVAELPAILVTFYKNGFICAVDILTKSMDNTTGQFCGDLQPGSFSLTASRAN